MKCKFKNYYKNAFITSNKTLKNKENFLKYYVFSFMTVLSYLLFFIRPIYKIVQKRMLKYVIEKNCIEISKSFEMSDKPILYWKQVAANVSKGLMVVGIGLMYLVAAALMLLLGYAFFSIFNNGDLVFLIFVFAIPVVIAFIAYILVVNLFVCPCEYILEKNPDIKNSNLLYLSIDVMKKQGKGVIFLNNLIYALINIVYIALGFILVLIISQVLEQNFAIALSAFIVLAFVSAYIIFFPTFTLTRSLVRYNLYADVMKDCISKHSLVTGVRFKEVKTANNDEELLLNLFEKSEEFNHFEKKILDNMPLLEGEKEMLQNKVSKEVEAICEEIFAKLENEVLEETEVVLEQAQEEVPVETVEEVLEETEVVLEQVQEEVPAETVEEVLEETEVALEQVQEEVPAEPVKEASEETEVVLEQVQEEVPAETVEEVSEEIEVVEEQVQEDISSNELTQEGEEK